MEKLTYRVIRSDRKTLALQLKNGELIVRAPNKTTDRTIADFVERHRAWVMKRRDRILPQGAAPVPFTEEELAELTRRAKQVIPERVAHFAPLVGVTYECVTIRHQRSRWGSCSGKGNLNFNCLLLLMPPEVLDYVVVHELCHRREMNHSKRFYAQVQRVMPDYRTHMKWLKEHGGAIMARNRE